MSPLIQNLKYIVALLLVPVSFTNAQNTITLDYCVEMAQKHYDFQRQREIVAEITDKNISRIDKGYLPTLELNAISTYQNKQITVPIKVPIPGLTFPTVPLNLNSALFTLRQWIYDGSMVHHSVIVERATGNIALLEIESQKLDVKTQVMQRFFAVLLTDKQIENMLIRERVLTDKLVEVNVAVANNVVLEAERDLLRAEILRLQASISETRFSRSEQILALSQQMGENLNPDARFEMPVVQLDMNASIEDRPDLKLLHGQIELLDARKGSISSIYLPKLGLFADVGVGYPGYDIFDPDPALMARVGVTLTWKIFDWNQGSLQQQSIDLNKQTVAIQRKRIQTQVSIQTESFLNAMRKADELMKSDEELLSLYTSVTNVYQAKLNNGTITSAEYVAQLTKQEEARINAELHKLQHLIAVLNYNTTLGK